uniref:CFA20 domain-containing protein n=1 Tax=Kwoniella dejecticola CBS 10117 TaxID=1296121 RepID=A0A1A5ZYY1_9TREE|nr:uncharacterized protein I303_06575 [Kwoniella dejecticola CBS 10117]OBR83016.1 hypothetical protein I303_06575 [Kwoniella dejecticola CBS 10117]
MSLLSGTIQPPLLSLLSSTSEPPLSPLFRQHTDQSADSSITFVEDTTSSLLSAGSSSSAPSRSTPHTQVKSESKGCISHNVIHIQSPKLRKTYIQAGRSRSEYLRNIEKAKGKGRALDEEASMSVSLPLGIELPWLSLQLKRLGRREISFEVGIVDQKGREGVVRFSSFKHNPTAHPYHNPPLIHLPLQLPSITQSTLTSWLHIPINLSSLLPLFSKLPRPQADPHDDDNHENGNGDADGVISNRKRRRISTTSKVSELPGGNFASSAEGEKTIRSMGKNVQDEWELYAAAAGQVV